MIKLVVFDFDGVFTDGKIFFDNQGNPMKHYQVKDGLAIFTLHNLNFEVGVISGWADNVSTQSIKTFKYKKIFIGFKFKIRNFKKMVRRVKYYIR